MGLMSHFHTQEKDSPSVLDLLSSVSARESLIAGLLLLFAISFNLVVLHPEVAIKAPMMHDGVLHGLALERMVEAWVTKEIEIDLWLPSVALGYPLFHHYEHLPYVVLTALSQILPRTVAALDLLRWANYLLLSFFPLSIYWSMRRFGFDRLTAAMSGLLSSLIATNGLYGFDFSSYVWSGYGLFTQLWGMFFLPPALAAGTRYMRSGQGLLIAALLLAITTLSHLLLGYMAVISLVALLFLPLTSAKEDRDRGAALWQRGKRLLILLGFVALLTAYFWLPFILDSPYLNQSVWEEPGKINGYGLEWTLKLLIRGDLFDFGRFPSLSILTVLGLIISISQWKEEHYRIPVILTILWLLLYFGRPTWGLLLDFLPLSGALHIHRFIAAVHLGGIFLMGIALAWPWRWALTQERFAALAFVAVLTFFILFPIYRERGVYLAQNERLMAESMAAYEAEKSDLDTLITTLQNLPPGRVYAGNSTNWGEDYTIGAVPVYALLNSAGLDMVGYLYHTLPLNADILVHFNENRFEHYDLFNIRYIVAPVGKDLPDFVHPVLSAGRHSLYQVRTSGYFELVTTDSQLPIDKLSFYPTAVHWLSSGQIERKEFPVLLMTGVLPDLDRRLSPPIECGSTANQPPAHTIYSHLISEEVTPDAYTGVVFVDHPSCLMLKSTYHPNWRATVDGHDVQTAMIMPSYVGIRVQPGTHQIHFEYQPRPQKRLLIVIGLLALILCIVRCLKTQNVLKLFNQ